MSLLQTILEAQGGAIIKQLSTQTGLGGQDTLLAVSKLLGGLNRNIQSNTRSPEGLEALLGAIKGGNHQRYLENQQNAFTPDALFDGNKILGHILGNKDASRALAGQVEAETGISSSILKKMLPIVATMAMGALGKQSQSSNGVLGQLLGGSRSSSDASSLLNTFLDRDRDGSILDDVMGMAAKFLR